MKNFLDSQSRFMRFVRSVIAWPYSPAGFLFFLCFITYFSSFQNGFKFDDFTHLELKPQPFWATVFSSFAKTSTQHYNPLDPFLNRWLFYLWGENVVPFHILNTTVFYFNAVCLFKIALLVIGSRWASLVAAALFVLHPLNAEIVNQVVFNSVLLSALFFQLGFILFDRYLDFRKPRDILTAFFFALISFLFLETAWILPGYLFCWAYFYKKTSLKSAFFITFPFWVICGCLFLLWRSFASSGSFGGGISQIFEYLTLTPVVFAGSLMKLVLWYVSKLFIPFNHIWVYSIPPVSCAEAKIYLSLFFVLGGIMYFFRTRIFESKSVFLWAWFLLGFLFLLPGSLAHPDYGLVIEPYWFFVSSMGFFMIFSKGLLALRKWVSLKTILIIVAGICSALFLITQRFHGIAKSEKSYSEYWMSIGTSPMPLIGLANAAFLEKQYQQAVDSYTLYLNRFSSSPYAYHKPQAIFVKLSLMYLEMGEISKAKEMVSESLKIEKDYADALIVTGLIALNQKDYIEAEKAFLKSLEFDPRKVLPRLNLVVIYNATQRDQKAIEILRSLVLEDLKKDDQRNVYARLAVLEFIYEDFEKSFQRVLELFKKDASVESFLVVAKTFERFGFLGPAGIFLEQAIKVYPKSRELYLMLGDVLKKDNNFSRAVDVWQTGAVLFPDEPQFISNISDVQKTLGTKKGD